MKCNICGSEADPSSELCKYCGNKIDWPEIIEDKNENEQSTDETNIPVFCSKCGRKLDLSTHKCLVCDLGIIDDEIQKNTEYTHGYKKVYNEKSVRYDRVKKENREENLNMASNNKRKSVKKKPQKKNPALVITLSVAGMMALFAISFLIFFNLLGGGVTKDEEETQMPAVTETAVTTATATVTPTSKPVSTPKPTQRIEQTQKPSQTKQPTSKPSVRPTEKNDIPITDGKYAYPSESQVITEEELNKMSRQQIKIILNEIYARHGYTFNDDDLVEYFESKTWYVPTISDMEEAERKFNDFEMENKNIIVEYQREQGWRE